MIEKPIYPSEEAGRELGVRLHYSWKIPSVNKMNRSQLEFLVRAAKYNFYFLDYLYDRFLELNPLLGSVKLGGDEYYNKWNVLYGAISKFCLQDIKEYVEIGDWRKRKKDKEWVKLHTAASSLCNIYWIPSTATLNRILKT